MYVSQDSADLCECRSSLQQVAKDGIVLLSFRNGGDMELSCFIVSFVNLPLLRGSLHLCLLVPGEDSAHHLQIETIRFPATLETAVLTSSFQDHWPQFL